MIRTKTPAVRTRQHDRVDPIRRQGFASVRARPFEKSFECSFDHIKEEVSSFSSFLLQSWTTFTLIGHDMRNPKSLAVYENPQTHRENTQTPHRKDIARIQTHNLRNVRMCQPLIHHVDDTEQ